MRTSYPTTANGQRLSAGARLAPLLTALLAALLWWGPGAAAAPEEPEPSAPTAVPVVPVTGVIGPAQSEWVRAELRAAAADGAPAVILRLDTPGGLTSAMRDIIQAILDSPVPVIGWVGPAGARAASAGTYILYACHVSAMAPGTNLGAATPVQMGSPASPGNTPSEEGDDQSNQPDSAKERKAVNDAAAYIRGLAELRGRNADWAERAVREAASLNARAAAEANVTDFLAANLGELLEGAEGRTASVAGEEQPIRVADRTTAEREPGWRTRLLSALTNPNVAYILMLIGIYGLIFELASPGAVVPGVVGAICLLLALYAFQALPVSYAGAGLLLLGIGLFVAEALLPSFGVLGAGGLVAFVLGSVLLMDTDVPALKIAWPVIATAGVVTGAFVLGVAHMAARSHRRQSVSGTGHLVGHTAEALEALDPEGHVRFEGERWRARADRPVPAGARVRITGVDGLTLAVAPLEEGAE